MELLCVWDPAESILQDFAEQFETWRVLEREIFPKELDHVGILRKKMELVIELVLLNLIALHQLKNRQRKRLSDVSVSRKQVSSKILVVL